MKSAASRCLGALPGRLGRVELVRLAVLAHSAEQDCHIRAAWAFKQGFATSCPRRHYSVAGHHCILTKNRVARSCESAPDAPMCDANNVFGLSWSCRTAISQWTILTNRLVELSTCLTFLVNFPLSPCSVTFVGGFHHLTELWKLPIQSIWHMIRWWWLLLWSLFEKQYSNCVWNSLSFLI